MHLISDVMCPSSRPFFASKKDVFTQGKHAAALSMVSSVCIGCCLFFLDDPILEQMQLAEMKEIGRNRNVGSMHC